MLGSAQIAIVLDYDLGFGHRHKAGVGRSQAKETNPSHIEWRRQLSLCYTYIIRLVVRLPGRSEWKPVKSKTNQDPPCFERNSTPPFPEKNDSYCMLSIGELKYEIPKP